jgi:hypothetical protein
MMTALYFFASFENASVDGRDCSASAKKRWSSTWQKYCERNSSWVQKIFAPFLSACLSEGELIGEVPLGILAARHLRKAYLDDRRLHEIKNNE